jgi:hypothetical protein
MEDKMYHLRIFCTKGPGVFVQLMQSLEAIGLEVLNANLTSLQDNILNTFIAEVLRYLLLTPPFCTIYRWLCFSFPSFQRIQDFSTLKLAVKVSGGSLS